MVQPAAASRDVDSFGAARLISWARRAAGELERRRVEINGLNVFPVPDADTGSNMAHTVRAALEEADKLGPEASLQEAAEALALGSMRGARGNSGVVLSQVIRAVAQSVGAESVSGSVFADALGVAVTFVDRAISDPVEGTVITVLRAAAAAAQEVRDEDLRVVAESARDAARTALENTPSQLEALRAAGVVDAGGAGLLILLEELVNEVSGSDASATLTPAHPASPARELEVMFFFTGPLAQLEDRLARMGTSLVISRADEEAGTVHIHSTDAGGVVELAYSLGQVSDLRLEVLPAGPVTDNPQRLIVALTPAGSLADLYAEAGAVTVAPGKDAVSEVLAAIRRSTAREVMLLPNGLLAQRNIAAIEKAARAFSQTVLVLPTVRLVSGIAALAVHDASQPMSTVAFAMSEAAGEMRTAVINLAGKASGSNGGATATAYGEVIAREESVDGAVRAACRRLLDVGGEQVTILFEPSVLEAVDTEALAAEFGVPVFSFPADGLGSAAEIGVE
ncbi:DAK2 domain protein [Corynebacterium capitovis DSM 44611]|uniref:DAK2 domain-containing protein n=1 Tax=Corynebacterium capitovis TaxID=131081 RepID=UPI0004760FFD|nr:DAK2 domain-containing protein [Corynebacterium capitovis]WKD57766.1 DAK2 domain protein [Corynebacterium capitovis DSM 44611]